MDLLFFIVLILATIVGLVGLFVSPILAYKHEGYFGKKDVFIYSSLIGTSISLLVSCWIYGVGLQTIPIILIGATGVSLIISTQWLFSRYVAGTAEAAGRSYIAFLVVSILFPLIGLIIVLLFQPNTNSRSNQQQSERKSSLTEDLTKLQSLKESGILSEEEFTKAKNKLIS
jgi:uncharacterized membrane protein